MIENFKKACFAAFLWIGAIFSILFDFVIRILIYITSSFNKLFYKFATQGNDNQGAKEIWNRIVRKQISETSHIISKSMIEDNVAIIIYASDIEKMMETLKQELRKRNLS